MMVRVLAMVLIQVVSGSELPRNFQREQLVAWCIVPFDASKRSPTERAKMVRELGMKRVAYDWRKEHVSEFEQEILQYQKRGIEFTAFWGEHPEAFRLFQKHKIHPQIWKMFGDPDGSSQEEKVRNAVGSLEELAERTAAMGCKLSLCNHGGWSGVPENLVSVCEGLHRMGHDHVGIVYNWHHGHEVIDRWESAFQSMQPYLHCLNLNGMNRGAEPKIQSLGKGEVELEMLRVVIDSGYEGLVGILDHRSDIDSKIALQENLDGLEYLGKQLKETNTLPSGRGLAAKYPGDQGLEKDDRVVLMEDFEQKNLKSLFAGWEAVKSAGDMSFSLETPEGSAGKQSLLMEREKGPGGSLYRRLEGEKGFEKIFVRYYVRFSEDCGELHHFGPCLGGNYPSTPWPMVKAGHPTDGARSFWSGIEPYGDSWTWDFYTYWCEMRGSPPRGQTWGNSFIRDPELKVVRGEWICLEQMIKLNDVGDTNGEQALWIDGKLVSHLGKGFPKGRWIFDKFHPGEGGGGVTWNCDKNQRENLEVPEGGLPFKGFRWRTIEDLKVNYLWLYVYTQKPAGHSIKVWYDDVVVATEYIGPISKE